MSVGKKNLESGLRSTCLWFRATCAVLRTPVHWCWGGGVWRQGLQERKSLNTSSTSPEVPCVHHRDDWEMHGELGACMRVRRMVRWYIYAACRTGLEIPLALRLLRASP